MSNMHISFNGFIDTAGFPLLYNWNSPEQIKSPCLCEGIIVFLHISLIGSFLVQYLWNEIGSLCRRKSVNEENQTQNFADAEQRLDNISLSSSYRTSVICCSVIFASNIVRILLLLQHKYRCHCRSMILVLAPETQAISSLIVLVAVSNFQKSRTMKLPWILRTWWICIFFQSAICIALDIHSSTLFIALPGILECIDVLNLLACTYLFAIAIKGKTGISFSTCSIAEPLMHSSMETKAEGKRESPYGRASLAQLVTFSWLNPLFAIGRRKPLEPDEVPDVDIKDSAEFLSHLFDNYLNTATKRDGGLNPSIYVAIFLFVRKKAAINGFFAVVSALASYVGPSMINDFVKFLSGKNRHDINTGYILALAFLSAKIVETVAERQWIFGARQLGLRLEAALISHIYKKGLHLSTQSQKSHRDGEIINYMNVDIQRITDVIWYLNITFMLPIQVTLAMYILYKNLGLGSLAGIAGMATIMLCSLPITRTQEKFQKKMMKAKDERMKATSEFLRNMKVLKLQAWDTQYLHKLEALRKNEYDWLWKFLRLEAISSFILWEASTIISVVTFGSCTLMGIPLTAGRVLSALATFRMLKDPIFDLPDLLSVLAQGKVSADRLAIYLQEDEINSDSIEVIPRNETEFDIEINHGTFSWDRDYELPTLGDIQLKVRRGAKVAICGKVGSGKSSLLSSILGEVPKMGGTVKISGSKAYAPQSPWIHTCSIRENILLGNPFDSNKYKKAIQACALSEVFERFANGDLTEIGDRRLTITRGQKQQIQLARAVYQDADIYLLDDTFSVMDIQEGRQLFQACLMNLLKQKTILYITNQIEFLQAADIILVMQNGRIAQAGIFNALLQQSKEFEDLVRSQSQALESIIKSENLRRISQSGENKVTTLNNCQGTRGNTIQNQFYGADKKKVEQNQCHMPSNRARMMDDKEREKGSISKEVYWSYLTAVYGGSLVIIIVIAECLIQVLQVASNYWMAWASPTTGMDPTVGTSFLFLVYMLLSVGSSLCVLVRAMLVAITGLLTSQKHFRDMLHSIFHAPLSFTDAMPIGCILNRASSDQSVLDLDIAKKLSWCAFSLVQILGTVTIMSEVAWPVFALFIPVTVICIWYQQYCIPTARELARISEIQRAPILHQFAESLSGATTIRAFKQENHFTGATFRLIDNHSRPCFHNVSAMEWLHFRLNLLSNFVFAFSLLLLVSLPKGFVNPSIAGLAVTYGFDLNAQISIIIWNICSTEIKMISVERILQYTRINYDSPLPIGDSQPPENWPEIGTICFKNLQVGYDELLQNITCTIPGRKKVGIVGQSGSGKSTLVQALFRVVEPRNGIMLIDGVDICKIRLQDLRSRLSIISQEPIMFEGTVRRNLDPLMEYSDHMIWEVLDKCQLGEVIRRNDKKLDSSVVENGGNWSVGQRQLFCLGRAFLKKNRVIVIDEATNSVDPATDEIMQKTICQDLKECTVITISHRVHTAIQNDLILVLNEGRIVEYDTPTTLLEKEDSAFTKLVKKYVSISQGFS